MRKMDLDKEESKLLDSYKRGEWRSLPDLSGLVSRHAIYAKNTLRKDTRINIRLSSQDMETIRAKAREDGLPYQTLISSLLHKYVSGRLKEKMS